MGLNSKPSSAVTDRMATFKIVDVETLPKHKIALKLQEAIERFRAMDPEVEYHDGTQVKLSWFDNHPRRSWGGCDGAAQAFAEFAENLCIEYVPSWNHYDSLIRSGDLPYQKHLYGDECHAYAMVKDEAGEVLFVVDWTAAQFGYQEFPLLWSRTNV